MLLISFACLFGVTFPHMLLSYPPALRYKGNPYSGNDVDYSLTNPLNEDGSDYPCKGSLRLLGTPEGTPVANWIAGQTYNMTLEGGSTHDGGSCQAAISTDAGATFHVIHSWEGGCPVSGAASSSFSFTLPSDTTNSDQAVFAWTWFNKIGNREMYSNCAVVTISGGRAGMQPTSFTDRPGVFVANINGCKNTEGVDTKFPSPGPDVSVNDPAAQIPTGPACTSPTASSAPSLSSSASGAPGNSPNSSTSYGLKRKSHQERRLLK
ncbi:putative endoglucanase [Diaporthe sp. PMI_573]|nr:putative endoglucanase [Diaporthaceae sp. PMI_573]